MDQHTAGMKRPLEDAPPEVAKKRSRFDIAPPAAHLHGGGAGIGSAITHAITAPSSTADAVARATALAAELASRVRSFQGAGALGSSIQPEVAHAVGVSAGSASVVGGRPAAARVRLDAQGRLVDEHGNVLDQEPRQVSTLRVNDPNRQVSAEQSVTRADRVPLSLPAALLGPGGKVNPYLAHRVVAAQAAHAYAAPSSSATTTTTPANDPITSSILEAAEAEGRRRRRGERTFHAAEEGVYAAEGDKMREEEARRAEIAALRQKGGRHRPVFHREAQAPVHGGREGSQDGARTGVPDGAPAPSLPAPSLPPRLRLPPPDMEWWDAAFLPKHKAKAYAQAQSLAGKKAAAAAAKAAEASTSGVEGAGADVAGLPAVPLLNAPAPPSFSYSELFVEGCATLALVQHPVPVTPLADPDAATGGAPKPMQLMLTKVERKKLRRQQRAEKHKFLLDQQKLGLLPPPEPKVRLANMMRVLKDAAVSDPSAVEARVRAQVAARQKTHEAHNKAGQLNEGQRVEKWRKKMTKHGPAGPDAAVFRVTSLSHGKARYKVDQCARDHLLGGIALVARAAGVVCVYVEGGTKAIGRYSRMMARFDWKRAEKEVEAKAARAARLEARGGGEGDEEDEDSEEEEDEEDDDEEEGGIGQSDRGFGPGGLCELVWKGTAPRRYFPDFSFEECRTSVTARKLLETKGLAYLWDVVSHSEHARRVSHGEELDALGEREEGSLLGSGGLLSLHDGMEGAGFIPGGAGDGDMS